MHLRLGSIFLIDSGFPIIEELSAGSQSVMSYPLVCSINMIIPAQIIYGRPSIDYMQATHADKSHSKESHVLEI